MRSRNGRYSSLAICGAMLFMLFQFAPAENASAAQTEDWIAIYNGPVDLDDKAVAMAVDESGNVYVTGRSLGKEHCGSGCGHSRYDFTTIKYNTTGDEQWVARYFESDDLNVFSKDIVRDPNSGNIYVTGLCMNLSTPDTFRDILTIAYSEAGTLLWAAKYNGPASNNDAGYSMAIDPASGNIYVTGKSSHGGGIDSVTVAYSPTGTELWVAGFEGASNFLLESSAIAVGPSGAVYVAGEGNTDYIIVAYDPATGGELWNEVFAGSTGYTDTPYAMVVDRNSGNVYVTGTGFMESENADYLTVAYDSSGNELWYSTYNGPGDDTDIAYDMTIDSTGHIYVTGRSFGVGSKEDYATIAYDNMGNELWVARLNGPGNDYDGAKAIDIDDFGNVYVTGHCCGSLLGADLRGNFLTVVYDSTAGEEIWYMIYDGPNGAPNKSTDFGSDVVVDQSGYIYVTGESYSVDTEYDFVTIKYAPPVRPTAVAGADLLIYENEVVQLDGTGSSSTIGDIVSYAWDLDVNHDSNGDNIADNDVDITGPTPSIAWWSDDYVSTVKLKVQDDKGGIAYDTMTVTVENLDPSGDFNVAYNPATGFEYGWTASDPGSDDLTIIFEIGPLAPITEVYFNDAVGPDPDPSPYAGTAPFGVIHSGQLPMSLPPGEYDSNLTISDDDGGTYFASKKVTVINQPPEANFSYSPLEPKKNDLIRFTDTSTDPESSVVTWSWEFGDGTMSTDQNPTHAFSAAETYVITLTVWDEDGGSNTTSKSVVIENSKPVASFTCTPENPMINEVIAYTDGSSDPDGTLVKWEWDFGDGTTSTDQNPTHSYSELGAFTVTLKVFDEDDGSNTTSNTIVIENRKPVADFTHTPENPKVNEAVTFTDNSYDPDGTLVTWEWVFGDGTSSVEKNPSHVYSQPGTYTVVLRVYDNSGDMSIYTQEITIKENEVDDDAVVHSLLWLIVLAVALILFVILLIILAGRRKKGEEDA